MQVIITVENRNGMLFNHRTSEQGPKSFRTDPCLL